jgi:hypothetical protein
VIESILLTRARIFTGNQPLRLTNASGFFGRDGRLYLVTSLASTFPITSKLNCIPIRFGPQLRLVRRYFADLDRSIVPMCAIVR